MHMWSCLWSRIWNTLHAAYMKLCMKTMLARSRRLRIHEVFGGAHMKCIWNSHEMRMKFYMKLTWNAHEALHEAHMKYEVRVKYEVFKEFHIISYEVYMMANMILKFVWSHIWNVHEIYCIKSNMKLARGSRAFFHINSTNSSRKLSEKLTQMNKKMA